MHITTDKNDVVIVDIGQGSQPELLAQRPALRPQLQNLYSSLHHSIAAIEYQGSKQIVASDEIKQQILKTGIRKLERETKVSHHTIERILKGEHTRRKTLAKVVSQLPAR